MATKDVLLRLRTEKKMTQDELAEKVFVTRQAVSRWEKGETTPNVETLKLLSGVFDVVNDGDVPAYNVTPVIEEMSGMKHILTDISSRTTARPAASVPWL